MNMTTAIIVNTFLLSAAFVALTLELSRRRIVAGVCMAAVLFGYAFNIFHVVSDFGGPYFAHKRGVNVHAAHCESIEHADPDDLRPFPTLQKAKDAGFRPHYCITNRDSTYTIVAKATPQINPSTKNQVLSVIP